MSDFYKNFVAVCAKKGVAPSKAAKDIGLSRTSPNGWKKGKKPSDVTLEKLSQYFGVPVSDLTGEGQKNSPAPEGAELTNTQKEAMEFVLSLSDDQLRQFIRIGKAMQEE